jgi:hypothetical protein
VLVGHGRADGRLGAIREPVDDKRVEAVVVRNGDADAEVLGA